MQLLQASPLLRQPPGPLLIDQGNPLARALSEVWVGSQPAYTARRQVATVLGGAAARVVSASGVGIATTASLSDFVDIGNADNIFGFGNECTIAIYRRAQSTVAANSSIFGYTNGSAAVASYAPWGDGSIYFDFGNNTAGSGRISTPYTKDLLPEALVFAAGAVVGREIWRRGVRIANNAAATAARTTSAALPVKIGANGAAGSPADLVETYLFIVANRVWSPAEIVSWSANPWQIFKPPNRRLWLLAAGGTTFSQTLSASLGTSASRIAAVQAIRAAAQSSAASLARSTVATRSTTQPTAPSLPRATQATRSTTTAVIATLATLKARLLTLIASIGSTATVQRAVQATRSTALASIAATQRAVQATRSAAQGSIATLATLKAKLLTLIASIGNTAATQRAVQATRSTALASIATLGRLKASLLTLIANIGSTAATQRAVQAMRSAALGSIATFATLKAKLLTLIANIGSTAATQRAVQATRSAVEAGNATVQRVLAATRTAGLASAASASKGVRITRNAAGALLASISAIKSGTVGFVFGNLLAWWVSARTRLSPVQTRGRVWAIRNNIMTTLEKRSAESVTYDLDFSQLLAAGETIASVTALIAEPVTPTPLTFGAGVVNTLAVTYADHVAAIGTVVQVRISGGMVKPTLQVQDYIVRCRVVTSVNPVVEGTVRLQLNDTPAL